MVREIVDHQHAARFAFHFEAPQNIPESRESFFERFALDAAPQRDGRRSESVQNIVPPGERRTNAGHFPAAARDAKFRGAVDEFDVAGGPIGFRGETVRFNSAKSFADGRSDRGVIAPGHDAAAARHEIYQTAELQLDCGEIVVDIGVIEFKRSHD